MGKKHTQETKNKISIARKKWLSENKDKHPWKRNDKFTSIPCEYLKDILLKNNIDFLSEVQPLKDRYFSIDIVLVGRGIGIEVNGNQHYNSDKSLKKYYRNRKKLIERNGWKIIDIYYTKVYDSEFVCSLIEFVNGVKTDIDLDFTLRRKEESKCIDCGVQNSKYSKRCITCHNISRRTENFYKKRKKRKKKEKEKSYCVCGREKSLKGKICFKCRSIEQRKVERPNIDVLEQEVVEMGYSAVGRKYGVSDNTIRKWIQK